MKRTVLAAMAAVFGLMTILAASQVCAQTPYKAQEPKVQRGQAEIELWGPAGFRRVDGLDHDIDETLAAYLPDAGQELAIFADPKAWKGFYDEIYGNNPSDLAYYATITASDELAQQDLTELDFDLLVKYFSGIQQIQPGSSLSRRARSAAAADLLESGLAAATPFVLLNEEPRSLTFTTNLGQLQLNQEGREEFKARYFAVMTAVLVRGQVIFLNVFTNDRGPEPDKIEALALAWRDDFLKKMPPTELEEALETL